VLKSGAARRRGQCPKAARNARSEPSDSTAKSIDRDEHSGILKDVMAVGPINRWEPAADDA
jgi:hypothetical protein